MIECKDCQYSQIIKSTGAIYCTWWQLRVKPDGWCYKGEEERNGGKQ